MKFRPCIDIHSGKVKQIVGSSLKDDGSKPLENFVSNYDADYYAELFKNDKLVGGHIIMLGHGNEEQAIKALKKYPSGLQIGGGINAENAEMFLKAGAMKVIVTSYVFKNGEINVSNLERMVNYIGKDKLVLDLSCKKKEGKYYVVTDRWQKYTRFTIDPQNIKWLENYCSEFLVHAVDVEGKRNGIETELVQKLASWTTVPTTYAGGVKSMEDIKLMKALGSDRIDLTIGSALDIFGGNLSYRKVVNMISQ
ncbi:phosphoribosylformimino-5-aminoimidazole carboxamide ribotide isomerase [Clostridium oryzae]|uniref:Imidazole glycerol phosphate synthase subunit HisF n=1 Tax=Clostridium oryzae TaxID=1450648 RepID=A0A1V4IP51_9CLOT|nr:phosphoribosylformimino-5-aminoimidazole carboxamide ribotide isomerase [Clostridium oryzae]OPJ61683.1 imidazole glycerol phosphate synthase subunit HisF [Clostridium oryzae]